VLEHVGRRRTRRLGLQREVQPLVPAVLLRMARRDALQGNPEPKPPDRELAQAIEGVRGGERDAIVGANRLGQTEVLERALEDRERVAFLRRRQRLTGQQVAAGEVGDRQRITVPPVAEQEFAFVVRAPEAIGGGRPGQRRAGQARPPPPRPAPHQPVPIQHRMHRADRRTGDLMAALPQALTNLGGAPTGELPLHPHDRLLDDPRQLVRVPIGAPAAIREGLHANPLIPLVDLVASFPRDPELLAERRHRLALEEPGRTAVARPLRDTPSTAWPLLLRG
jgi:hypothetical protein